MRQRRYWERFVRSMVLMGPLRLTHPTNTQQVGFMIIFLKWSRKILLAFSSDERYKKTEANLFENDS